ncbi:MAG: hypothetical protein HRF40_15025 [Nitrososphaera sp.]
MEHSVRPDSTVFKEKELLEIAIMIFHGILGIVHRCSIFYTKEIHETIILNLGSTILQTAKPVFLAGLRVFTFKSVV